MAVPNASFELPLALSPAPNINSWQKTPKPDWYDESGSFFWTQLSGVFANPAPGSADRIVNCDGAQAIWLFAVPEVGLFQDYDSMDWNDAAPTHDFNAVFAPGESYQLTVGLFGGGAGGNYGMLLGVTLELSLYYRDAASNRVTVAATTITNSAEIFTSNTNLVDFSVHVPVVQPGDPWAGQHIGVLLLSTVDTNLQGGYWDLDNVRLKSTLAPTLENPVWTNGQFQFTLRSEPGLAFDIQRSADPAVPEANWVFLDAVTNTGGTLTWVDTNANFNQRFYRARQLP